MDPGSMAILVDGIEQLAYVVFGVCLVGFLVLGAVWVVKILTGARLSRGDEAVLLEVSAKLAVVERRMAALERILDAEVPAWRVGFEDIGDGYGRRAG